MSRERVKWKNEGLKLDKNGEKYMLKIDRDDTLYMEYVGGSNWLVPIVDETSPDGLDGEVLTEVAEPIEGRVAPAFEERIFDRQLPPPFVRCKRCGV